jgi:hypothetical protein
VANAVVTLTGTSDTTGESYTRFALTGGDGSFLVTNLPFGPI